MSRFVKHTAITTLARILCFLLGIIFSVLIARCLGPEGRGSYAVCLIIPNFLFAFLSLGIAPATVYHVSQERFPLKHIFSTNTILSILLGLSGILIGGLVIVLGHETVVPGGSLYLLLLALPIFACRLLTQNLNSIFWGSKKIVGMNLIGVISQFLLIVLIVLLFVCFGAMVFSAILGTVLAWALTTLIAFVWIRKFTGTSLLQFDAEYAKESLGYGLRAHFGNILQFLNYRLDILLVNIFLNREAVGFYAIGVGLAEKLWLISQSSGAMLFPIIASETNEDKRKQFTPIVARSVLWITVLGAALLFVLSPIIITLLFSEKFLASVAPFRVLLVGVTVLSAAKVLANDIAARGKPIWNSYVAFISVASNILLNIIWIPKYGIVGAAGASCVSYSVTFVLTILLYCHISKNSWHSVLFPRKSDLILYKRILLFRKK